MTKALATTPRNRTNESERDAFYQSQQTNGQPPTRDLGSAPRVIGGVRCFLAFWEELKDSACLTRKNARLRSGEILVSTSSRTSSGSWRPARAKFASACGMVAENSRVCRFSLMRCRMALSCSAKPISKSLPRHAGHLTPMRLQSFTSTIEESQQAPDMRSSKENSARVRKTCRSASSNTTYSTFRSVRPLTSSKWCARRPEQYKTVEMSQVKPSKRLHLFAAGALARRDGI
jgi:hypothetical protein